MRYLLVQSRRLLSSKSKMIEPAVEKVKPEFAFIAKPALRDFPRKYDAAFVESRWYDWWISQGYFTPSYSSSTTKSTEDSGQTPRTNDIFTVMLPPPNITGSLHLGHALTIAVEEAILRWNRMQGRRVLWVPGLDHAGIATQVQVESKLWQKKKKTRHDVGRGEFQSLANAWKVEKSDTIVRQLCRMGAVVDWSRLSFTLDPKIQTGVAEAFIRLFDKGKIHRQERLVNWCSHLKSTISDIEVQHLDVPNPTTIRVPGENDPVDVGWLSCFAYPVADSAFGEEIVVATTRLETMLGDVAVAVNPTDKR